MTDSITRVPSRVRLSSPSNGARAAGLSALIYQVSFVEPEVAWAGLNDLQRRSLGESADLGFGDVAEMTPAQAIDRYDRTVASILSQLYVDGPDRGQRLLDSLQGYSDSGGDLRGAESIITSAGLGASANLQLSGPLEQAAQLLQGAGVGASMGAGRGLVPVMDQAFDRFASLTPETLQRFMADPVGEGAGYLRNELAALVPQPHGTSGNGDSGGQPGSGSGGGFQAGKFFGGLIQTGVGVCLALTNPVGGVQLAVDGVVQTIDASGLASHPTEPSVPAGSVPAAAGTGTRTIETETTHTRVERTNPDGSREVTVTDTVRTKTQVPVDSHPLDGTGPGVSSNRMWTDEGGGRDPVTGLPIPISPITTVTCQPSGTDELPTGVLDGPRRDAAGTVVDFAGYPSWGALLEAPRDADDRIDLDATFADWTLSADGTFDPPVEVVTEPVTADQFGDERTVFVTSSPPAGATEGVRVRGARTGTGNAIVLLGQVDVAAAPDPALRTAQVLRARGFWLYNPMRGHDVWVRV